MSNNSTMTIDTEMAETLFICAVRYALGRRTYMPHIITEYLETVLNQVSTMTLKTIERDIKDSTSYGDESIDKPAWMKLLASVSRELEKRNKQEAGRT